MSKCHFVFNYHILVNLSYNAVWEVDIAGLLSNDFPHELPWYYLMPYDNILPEHGVLGYNLKGL